MDSGGKGIDLGIGEGRGLAELLGPFGFDSPDSIESAPATLEDRTFLELAGVDRARCGLLGLKDGGCGPFEMGAPVSIVRFLVFRCSRVWSVEGRGDPS